MGDGYVAGRRGRTDDQSVSAVVDDSPVGPTFTAPSSGGRMGRLNTSQSSTRQGGDTVHSALRVEGLRFGDCADTVGGPWALHIPGHFGAPLPTASGTASSRRPSASSPQPSRGLARKTPSTFHDGAAGCPAMRTPGFKLARRARLVRRQPPMCPVPADASRSCLLGHGAPSGRSSGRTFLPSTVASPIRATALYSSNGQPDTNHPLKEAADFPAVARQADGPTGPLSLLSWPSPTPSHPRPSTFIPKPVVALLAVCFENCPKSSRVGRQIFQSAQPTEKQFIAYVKWQLMQQLSKDKRILKRSDPQRHGFWSESDFVKVERPLSRSQLPNASMLHLLP